MRTSILLLFYSAVCLIAWTARPCFALAAPSPCAIMGQDLVRQLQHRADNQGVDLDTLTFVVTTPVNLDDLTRSSPLARFTAENLSMWLVRQGFRIREIRRADAILMAPRQGEMSLTRKPEDLYTTTVSGTLLVTGTYTVLSDRVLFHIRVLKADSNEVLAMTHMTLPRDANTNVLLTRNDKKGRTSLFAPSVTTSLPAY
ncbi:FlgO family outer membrane protein [Desulfoplanes formicivorans]|nr:FlgO family outer membrane protein [Desulfoplanes formicivorans]